MKNKQKILDEVYETYKHQMADYPIMDKDREAIFDCMEAYKSQFNNWIGVGDIFPINNQKVDVLMLNGKREIDVTYDKGNNEFYKYKDVLFPETKTIFLLSHWMPLPNPPIKEQTKERENKCVTCEFSNNYIDKQPCNYCTDFNHYKPKKQPNLQKELKDKEETCIICNKKISNIETSNCCDECWLKN